MPAGSFIDVDTGDLLSYSATRADGTALPTWLTFDALTQTFSGRVPKDATGAIEIKVSVIDRAGATASDVFTLTFSGKIRGGGQGGGSHGNEGVGNGVDGPPPGHDQSFNDGPGTGPGNPGAQGGNGNPLAPGLGHLVPLPIVVPDEGPVLVVGTTGDSMADQVTLVGVEQSTPYGTYDIV